VVQTERDTASHPSYHPKRNNASPMKKHEAGQNIPERRRRNKDARTHRLSKRMKGRIEYLHAGAEGGADHHPRRWSVAWVQNAERWRSVAVVRGEGTEERGAASSAAQRRSGWRAHMPEAPRRRTEKAGTVDPIGRGTNDANHPNAKSVISWCLGTRADTVSHLRNRFSLSS
jgi:hypothetical protein